MNEYRLIELPRLKILHKEVDNSVDFIHSIIFSKGLPPGSGLYYNICVGTSGEVKCCGAATVIGHTLHPQILEPLIFSGLASIYNLIFNSFGLVWQKYSIYDNIDMLNTKYGDILAVKYTHYHIPKDTFLIHGCLTIEVKDELSYLRKKEEIFT